MANGINHEGIRRELESISASAKARNNKRIGLSLLIAALIALLLWKTQWPAIQPGLGILLAGQIGLAGFLAYRNSQLKQFDGTEREADVGAFFAGEEAALTRSTLLENGSRLLGFAALAFGFWRSTGNLVLALALGVIYPVVVYWGLARANSRRARVRLRAQQQRLQALSQDPDHL